ncbi:MAG: GlsB/YeaQ/YmgE family stress response membrane protein [Sphingomonadales bacterium]|nr:GlsB/YeaQ/YmgE family stress response membrane protein [Sphingomonadales bacterium]MDE2170217.1 GlsB/YeaQ/YmgE family stress response membrane protein [Sphingomonadales bacterium]
MAILTWILIGIVVGWLAGMIMGSAGGILIDFVVGIAGAFIGGLIFARGNINDAPLTVSSFVVSLLGAVILLGVVNLLRRGRLV